MKKEPPDSRFRRKPNQSRKLKLLCSFNGAFQRKPPPSGKLSYVGGETRFVSVDRTIGFANLRARLSEICPGIPTSFSLWYQLSSDATPAAIGSDGDVRCMVEELEELEIYGKNVRLWVFVCENRRDDVGDKMSVSDGNCVVNGAIGYVGIESRSNKVRSGNGDKNGDGSLRIRVLRQQLLSKQLDMVNKTNESERKCRNGDLDTDQPLVDLRTQPRASVFGREDYAVNLSNYSCMGSEMHLLKPSHGNLQLESNGPASCLPRIYHCDVIGNNAGTSSQLVSASQPTTKGHSSSVVSVIDDCNAKHESRNIARSALSILNKDNRMPQPENFDFLKSSFAPSYGNLCDANSLHASKTVLGRNRTGIRSHRFVASDRRNQQGYHPYHLRTYQSEHAEMNKTQTIQTDGRLSGGKFYIGLRPNSNILKQGHSSKFSNFCRKPCHGIPDFVQCGDAILMDSGIVKLDAVSSHDYADPRYVGSNFRKCHSVSNGKYNGQESPFMSSEGASRSPCANVTADSVDLTSSACQKLEFPISSENLYAACVRSGISHSDIEHIFAVVCSQNIDISASRNAGASVSSGDSVCSNRTEIITNSKLFDAEQRSYRGGTSLSIELSNDHTSLHAGISSSLDHLSNLSLSPSTQGQLHSLSSNASSQVVDALPKFHESIRNLDDPSPPNAAKFEQDCNQGEPIKNGVQSYSSIDGQTEDKESRPSSKVMSKISCNSTAIYTHLATQGLQTIKNADLEYLKELGCGTYGTVFYGKWKGSDVAIKRIKPSCFSEGSVEQEKLVADFWREANILGQLHHPNVVAFYGVVKDDPKMNLATVTEYMVNGSLKQFFRRKDRSIDRRKRLILAMDAAIGMEYLHEKNIVHFDLKSHNLLVNMRDPKRPVCKIGDFGLSKIKRRTLVSGGIRGTIPWMAPELLNVKSNLVTEKVDVYSFGIVMWELLTGEDPYSDLRSEEIIDGLIKGTLRPEIPSWCDPSWRLLMERCWSSDPSCRPSLSEIAKELRAMSAAMDIG